MADMVRKHITLPRALAEEFEQATGGRKQSEQLAQLIEVWLKKQRLLGVVELFSGFATAADYPHWATPGDVNEWVREMRAERWPNTGR